jgi:probable phosphoglycerate mutase
VTRLYLARHGHSRANLEGVLSHRVDDHPLTDRGRRQAVALAGWLAERDVSAIFSSPLERALETASLVSGRIGVTVLPREGLREVNVGALDGRGDEEAWTTYHDVVGRWRHGDLAARFPGGEDFGEAHDRLVGILQEAMSGQPSGRLAVISHGEILTQVMARLVTLPVGTEPGLGVAALIVVDHDEDGWRCLLWNSAEHLASLPPEDR